MKNLLTRMCIAVLTVSSLGAASQVVAQSTSSPQLGMGVMVGEVTATSAFVQTRLTTTDQLVEKDVPGIAGSIKFLLVAETGGQTLTQVVKASPKRDFIARAVFQDLQPNTSYKCMVAIDGSPQKGITSKVARFQTLPGEQISTDVKFVVISGLNYAKFHGDDRIDLAQHKLENDTDLPKPYTGKDKHLGYPGLASITKVQPDFLIGTGDNVYYDTPDDPRAETRTELRQKWHEQFVQPRFRDLFAVVPTYWMIDDHDYRIDDGDNSGDHKPTPAEGRHMMLEQLPVASHQDKDAKTYRTHRVSKDLQIWFPENRMYRSDNLDKDGPDKSIWGKEQTAWLKETLLASDAKFKLLISPTPMIGPDDARKTDNHTNLGGFRYECDAFFAWLKKTGIDKNNFYIICGDRHWQYHSVHSTGIEEFSTGALVDANTRLGRKPGDPLSTDPKGLIKQPYYQTPRSGGFLTVEVQTTDAKNPQLKFTWKDELGKQLHEHVKE
ncbi:MAG: alkaline phosphatase D family protein [Pirellulales bacterium]